MKKIIIISFVLVMIALVSVVFAERKCNYQCMEQCKAAGGSYNACQDKCCID